MRNIDVSDIEYRMSQRPLVTRHRQMDIPLASPSYFIGAYLRSVHLMSEEADDQKPC